METLVIGSWKINPIMPYLFKMTSKEVNQLLAVICAWEKAFVEEGNWVQTVLQKPSLLLRMDYVLQKNGSIGVYEVEERPCGIGMGLLLHPVFREKFSELFTQWQEFCGGIELVVSEKRKDSSDDIAWAQEMEVPIHVGLPSHNGAVYWVRADPEEEQFHHLAPHSLTTISTEGNKQYGVSLGLWKDIPGKIEELPWESGFAAKPCQGSRMHNMYLWKPKSRDKGGIATRTKIQEAIRQGNVSYYQEWIEPEAFLTNLMLVRRVFFGYDVAASSWTCLGGFYTARTSQYRLHGAQDAQFGLIMSPS